MRVAFVLGSIPTRNDQETNLYQAIVEKKDWLGQQADSVSEELARRHPGSSVSVHLMYSWTSQLCVNGVEWFATKPPGIFNRRYFYQGKQWSGEWMRRIVDWKPDLVHWQMNSYAYTFFMASRVLVRQGIPYVYQHHGPRLARKPWVRQILKFPHRHASRGIYLTREHERAYREGLGLDSSRNVVIPVGYEEKFHVMDREVCRRTAGLTGSPVLLWCGGLSERKDPITVLRAYGAVAAKYPESRLYMVGYGPLEARVRQLVSSHAELRERVTLLGYVNNDRIPEMANVADIFVLGSHGEGFSIASMEAMACGAFPVLTTLPCFQEQTTDGRYGLLFEPGDVAGCAAHLDRAMGDVAFRESIRAELPEAMKRYCWKHASQRLVTLYEEVLGIDRTA